MQRLPRRSHEPRGRQTAFEKGKRIMLTGTARPHGASSELLREAVHRGSRLSVDGVLERLFTLAFRDLVYPLIWEDPCVDLAAMEITPACRLVTIASGGCNVLNYLTADPKWIFAVDLN